MFYILLDTVKLSSKNVVPIYTRLHCMCESIFLPTQDIINL